MPVSHEFIVTFVKAEEGKPVEGSKDVRRPNGSGVSPDAGSAF